MSIELITHEKGEVMIVDVQRKADVGRRHQRAAQEDAGTGGGRLQADCFEYDRRYLHGQLRPR